MMQSREETHVSQIVSTPESKAKAQRMAEADMKNLVQWQTPEQVLKSRADRCTTHHYACDCREYRAQKDRERITKVIAIAGADPGDIDGAIIMLKERQRQIGLQSQELGQLRGRVNELEEMHRRNLAECQKYHETGHLCDYRTALQSIGDRIKEVLK